jgi:hypothetical protein
MIYFLRFVFVLRSCRNADAATDFTAFDFEVLSSLPAVRPTRFEVVIDKLSRLPCRNVALLYCSDASGLLSGLCIWRRPICDAHAPRCNSAALRSREPRLRPPAPAQGRHRRRQSEVSTSASASEQNGRC